MTREEKERLLAEIEKQYKWLMTKSPTIYMMDIAFDAIRKAVREASKEQQEPIIDKIKAEIEKQYKWLLSAEVTTYNIDIAFDAIRKAAEGEKE